jgi:hypothetical protein
VISTEYDYSTLMLARWRKASRNFSLETLLPAAARADLAAAWSSATVASCALQELQATMEELVAFAGAAKSWAPQAAQVRILGVFMGAA